MASATQLGSVGVGTLIAPTLAQCEAQFELGITLQLFLWPSLSLAVANNWGGPDSKEKREFLASAVIDELRNTPDADAPYVEEMLLNYMLDEFEINVDDDSAWEVSEAIFELQKECAKGEFSRVVSLKERFEARGGRDVIEGFMRGKDEEIEGEDEDEDEGMDGMDVDGEEAPQLVERRTRERVVPEVDEEGFTTVSKKRR